MYFMHWRSTEEERNDNYPLNRFRALFFIILLATFVCLPGCLGSIASHYKTEGYTSPSKPVFVPDTENPKHAPLIDSTIKSLVETQNGKFLGATEIGWLLFDHEFQLQESALFGQRYASVKAISTIHGQWVYGSRSSDLDQSLTEHHVYRIDDPSPVYSYQCNTGSSVWWSGHYVLDLFGDGHSSLALLCGNEDPDHYIAFLSLRDGLVSKIEVPFKPLRAFLSTKVDGKQSINFMRSFPSVHYARDIDTPSPIYRSLDNQSASKVVLSIESTTSEEYVKRYSTIDRFLTPPDLNDRELLVLDAVYPGRIFLSWNFDGTLQNWWYFDLKKSFRLVGDWLDLARIRPESEDDSKIAVLYGWGHWCQWEPCGYGIFHLKPNGHYKLIDFTTKTIDSILVATDDRLVATWQGRIYQYDLDSIRVDIPWKESIIPAKHITWMAEQSGLLESEIRQEFVIAEE